MSKVAIVQCNNYELEEVKKAIENAIRKTDFPVVKGKKILLKPNILSDANPSKVITTNPIVLQATIQIFKEKGAEKIYVGDSPALHGKDFRPNGSKLNEICEKEKVEWVDFSKDTITKKIPIANQRICVAGIIDKIDFSVSLSKFKTHEFMFVTGSIKNMFGLVPGRKKSAQHLRHPSRSSFAKLICGIASIAKVEYTIMDAIVGMEGHGPANGTPIKVGKIIAGKDPLAVDIAEAIIMGYEPMKMPLIECALKNHITSLGSVDDVKYPLINANDIIMQNYNRVGRKNSVEIDEDAESEYLSRPTPVFDYEKCIQCKKCVEVCPAKALNLIDENVIIDQWKCIRCYCCHEVCPVNAIIIEN